MKTIAVCILLLVAACAFSGGPARLRYQLDTKTVLTYAPDVRLVSHAMGIAQVAQPEVMAGLDTDRIQVQRAEGTLAKVDNALWVAPLGQMLQPILMRAMEESGTFRAVVDENSPVNPNAQLRVAVERFTLVYPADAAPAHVEVALRIHLLSVPGNRLLLSKVVSACEPVQSLNMRSVVAAFERALGECLNDAGI